MENANRAEVPACLDRARLSADAGDFVKAAHFIVRARRYAGGPDGTIDHCEHIISLKKSNTARTSATSSAQPSATTRPRVPADASAATQSAGSAESAPSRPYTPDQAKAVQDVLRAKSDLYQILGVAPNASTDEMKRAFKKKALRLHPDKCTAPGAELAFKHLTKAHSLLCDPARRRRYDVSGDDGEQATQQRMHRGGDPFEDFFNAFAGPKRPRHRQAGGGPDTNNGLLAALLPMIMIVLMMFLSNAGGRSRAVYSLDRSREFHETKVTATMQVNYFVTPEFDGSYPYGTYEWQEVEQSVERTYVARLDTECFREQQRRDRGVREARRQGRGEEHIKRLQTAEQPRCSELQKLRKKFPDVFHAATRGGW